MDKKKEQFFKDIGYNPQPQAMKLHEEIDDKQFIFIVGGPRSGKSSSLIPELLYRCVKKPYGNYWIVAVDYALTHRFIFGKQKVKGVLGYIRSSLKILEKRVNRREHVLELRNGNIIQGKSAKYESSFSAEALDGIVIEDAHNISERFFNDNILSRVADTGGFIWVNAVSPDDSSHWVYEWYERAKKDKSIGAYNFKTTENPYAEQKYIQSLKLTAPSSVFQKLNGVLQPKGETILSNAEFELEPLKYDPTHIYSIGIDVARKRTSRTCIVVLDLTMKAVARVFYLPKGYLPRQEYFKRITPIFDEFGRPPINVDSAGIGLGTYEELKKRGYKVKDGAVNSLKRRNALIERVFMMVDRGWKFQKNSEYQAEFNNIKVVTKETKGGSLSIFYVRRDTAIGDDGIIATGLAYEGNENFENIGSEKRFELKQFEQPQENDLYRIKRKDYFDDIIPIGVDDEIPPIF